MRSVTQLLFVFLSPFIIIPLGLLTAPFFPKGRGNPVTIPLLLFIVIADFLVVSRYFASKNRRGLLWKIVTVILTLVILGVGFLVSNALLESGLK